MNSLAPHLGFSHIIFNKDIMALLKKNDKQLSKRLIIIKFFIRFNVETVILCDINIFI